MSAVAIAVLEAFSVNSIAALDGPMVSVRLVDDGGETADVVLTALGLPEPIGET